MRAAEGELIVVALDHFLADRAVEAEREFAGHRTLYCSGQTAGRMAKIALLNDLRNQIVVMSLGDLAAVELAGLWGSFLREVVD